MKRNLSVELPDNRKAVAYLNYDEETFRFVSLSFAGTTFFNASSFYEKTKYKTLVCSDPDVRNMLFSVGFHIRGKVRNASTLSTTIPSHCAELLERETERLGVSKSYVVTQALLSYFGYSKKDGERHE